MFRNSCKVVQRTKKKKKKAHTQIHKLFFKPKHIWMIMEPCVALKRNICIYLIVYINFYSFTDLSRGSANQGGGFCVGCFIFYFLFFFKKKMLFHRGCCQNKSIALKMGWTTAYSMKGRVYGLGALPPQTPLPASWLWGDPAPQCSCPLACLQMGPRRRGGGRAVRPWRINQKALLVRVFSSMLCLCVYPNALEDYLCCVGLLRCRSGWVMLEWFGWF